jgi:hypothetical protein
MESDKACGVNSKLPAFKKKKKKKPPSESESSAHQSRHVVAE